MKAILEFNLPEERYDYDSAVNGYKVIGMVEDLVEDLRSIYKHGPRQGYNLSPEEAGKFRNLIIEFINEEDLTGIFFK